MGLLPVLVRREVFLILGPDTTFIRKGSVLAISAGHYYDGCRVVQGTLRPGGEGAFLIEGDALDVTSQEEL